MPLGRVRYRNRRGYGTIGQRIPSQKRATERYRFARLLLAFERKVNSCRYKFSTNCNCPRSFLLSRPIDARRRVSFLVRANIRWRRNGKGRRKRSRGVTTDLVPRRVRNGGDRGARHRQELPASLKIRRTVPVGPEPVDESGPARRSKKNSIACVKFTHASSWNNKRGTRRDGRVASVHHLYFPPSLPPRLLYLAFVCITKQLRFVLRLCASCFPLRSSSFLLSARFVSFRRKSLQRVEPR